MKTAIPSFVVLGVCAAAAALPRLAQNPAYHRFADHRTGAGLPNGADVLSNVPFAVCEAADARIFSLTDAVSGHTLKHLAAAPGIGCIVAMLRARAVGASAWREPW